MRQAKSMLFSLTAVICILHAHIHAHKHASAHSTHSTHTRTRTRTRTHARTHVLTHARTYIRTYRHTYVQAYIQAYIHACIHTYRHTDMHADIHTYRHTDMHADMHAGLQSLDKKGKNEHSKAMTEIDSETITPAELNTTVRFVQGGGALQILRVLSKLCDEPTYIKISNWLVFNARSSDCMRLCYFVLSMLTAQPKFAEIVDQRQGGRANNATTGSAASARHAHEERLARYVHAHVYQCVYICP